MTPIELYKSVLNEYFPDSYFWTPETVPPAHKPLYTEYHNETEVQQYLRSRYAHHLKTQADRALVKLANAPSGTYAAADVTALKVLFETSGILDIQSRPQTVTVMHYIPSPYAELEEGETYDTSDLT